MIITRVRLHRISMPLVSPFTTSFGTEHVREVIVMRALTADGDGWGECVTLPDPLYSPEYADGAVDVMKRFLIPALTAASTADTPSNSAGMKAK